MKNNKRQEELVKKLEQLREEMFSIKKQIDEINYSEELSKLQKYIGKCYSLSDQHIHSVFIYGVDELSLSLKGLVIHDYSNGGGTHFGIEYSSHYSPIGPVHPDKYKEISKKKFDEQFKIIQEQIQKCLLKFN